MAERTAADPLREDSRGCEPSAFLRRLYGPRGVKYHGAECKCTNTDLKGVIVVASLKCAYGFVSIQWCEAHES